MESFNWQPDYQLKRKRKPEKYSISFGDGYSQQIAVGVNLLRQTFDLSFSNNFAIIYAIEQFLESRGGVEDFLWTTPNGDNLIFYCKEWSVDYSTYANNTLSATFEQR